MYPALARGHATAFIAHRSSHADVATWLKGSGGRAVMDSFEASCLSKKPGRCQKRLAPLLKPAFHNPAIVKWTRQLRYVTAAGLSAAADAQVFDLTTEDTPLFTERSVFLNNLLLDDTPVNTTARLLTLAGISHHAIARLLERDLCTPETVRTEVVAMLSIGRSLALGLERCALDPDETRSFLVPYRGGALPVLPVAIDPDTRIGAQSQKILSIRTYLSPDMISPEDSERMGGFDEAIASAWTSTGSEAPLLRWMEVNSRPWTMRAASRLSGGAAENCA